MEVDSELNMVPTPSCFKTGSNPNTQKITVRKFGLLVCYTGVVMGLTGGPWNLKRISRDGPRLWSYENVMGYFNESWVCGNFGSHRSRVSYEIRVRSKIAVWRGLYFVHAD